MKAAIINGEIETSSEIGVIIRCLESLLASSGYAASVTTLREKHMEPCKMCKSCSVTTQWSCGHGDDWAAVAQSAINADLLVLISPISFGCHSSLMKSFLDRLLYNLSPNYMRSQTGPAPGRHSHYLPRLCIIGLISTEDAEQEATFKELCRRNGLNFGSLRCNSAVLSGLPTPRVIGALVNELLEGVIS